MVSVNKKNDIIYYMLTYWQSTTILKYIIYEKKI